MEKIEIGNLKNPPKSAAALGAQFKQNPNMNSAPKKKATTKITKVQLSQQIILPKRSQIRKSFKTPKSSGPTNNGSKGNTLAVVVIVQPTATTLLIIP